MGIIAYAFLANQKHTRNRPADEHRFQVKYGSKDGKLHELHQDPFGLYTTLFIGINPDLGIFVGADPEIHNPTKFFISLEFKHREVETILKNGWHFWERDTRGSNGEPVEVLVGGTSSNFLKFVRFERAALREDPGHRQALAEKIAAEPNSPLFSVHAVNHQTPAVASPAIHALATEFEMPESQVLDLIASARRLKMAVRGWVAEEKLVGALRIIPGVTECVRLDEEGGPDVTLRFESSKRLTIQCKNALRQTTADGTPRLDLQKTRASKGDPCSRYYKVEEFDVIAACLHSITSRWEFRYVTPENLDIHRVCAGRLANNVRVDHRWTDVASQVLRQAANG